MHESLSFLFSFAEMGFRYLPILARRWGRIRIGKRKFIDSLIDQMGMYLDYFTLPYRSIDLVNEPER